MNCVASCPRDAPNTLRNATSRARWIARAVLKLTKFTTAMASVSSATTAKVPSARGSPPGVSAPS